MKYALLPPWPYCASLVASLVLELLSSNAAAVEATNLADGYTSTTALKSKFGAAGGASKAIPVGPSLSPSTFLKPDAFAVHVFEVV